MMQKRGESDLHSDECKSLEHFKIYRLISQFNFVSLLQIIFVFVFTLNSDSAFTERILGLPNENYKGFVEADVTQRARHIPSHSFYLLHGLADSSVPYLHGTQLARALAKAGIIFQYQVSSDIAMHNLFSVAHNTRSN